MVVRRYNHFIAGEEVAPRSGRFIDRQCPANGELAAKFAEGNEDDVQLAIETARKAFDEGPWPRMSGQERGDLLARLAASMADEKERLARIEAEEVGKPIRIARGDIGGAIALTRYAAGLAMQLHGEAYTTLGPNRTGLVIREPAGVVGMIVPWNFPLLIFTQKVPFALAAGCTCVVKPSELTSGTALEVAKLAAKVGLPSGVLNIVTGYGDTVGEPIGASAEVDMVSFTGSTAVGRRVVRNSAGNLKRVSVELGGKAANIVFDDADLDDAIDGTMMGIFMNQGEVCCSGTRLLIQESVADQFLQRLVQRAGSLKVGDPFSEDTDVGAMIHGRHMEKVLEYVAKGQDEGAKLLTGGTRLRGGDLDRGYFVAPTVFDGVEDSMTLFRDEIFGPVLSVTRFRTPEEAVALANNTEYGLANGVWSKDVDKVMEVSQALRSGTVWVNTMIDGAPQLPFGGYKASGFGREMGTAGLEEFTEVKSILLCTGKRDHVFG